MSGTSIEENYKYYYEEDGFTLHVRDRVWYTQCGPNKCLTLYELLKRTTDISTEDFRLRGMSMDYMAQKGFLRIVARSSFRIHRMPVRDEEIEVITTEEKPSAVQIIQTYEFKDKDGNPLISGESEWMFLDPQNRRLVPTKSFDLRVPNTERKEHDCLPNGRIARPDNLMEAGNFKIAPSHLDGNGHVNNAWYAAFVTDCLPQDFQELTPKDFRINYSRELLLGDLVKVSLAISEDRKKVTLIGEKEKELSFECELYF